MTLLDSPGDKKVDRKNKLIDTLTILIPGYTI